MRTRSLLLGIVLSAAVLVPASRAQQPGSTSAPEDVSFLVGQPYLGLPGGWASVGGSLHSGRRGAPDHTLTLFENVHDDSARLLLYTRIDTMVQQKHPLGTIVAALRIALADDEVLVWAGCSFRRTLIAVTETVAVDSTAEVVEWGPVRRAWDLHADAFRPLDVEGLACEPIEQFQD